MCSKYVANLITDKHAYRIHGMLCNRLDPIMVMKRILAIAIQRELHVSWINISD